MVDAYDSIPSYHFSSHFHPYVQELAQKLIKGSMAGLQDADTAGDLSVSRELFTKTDYDPTPLVGTSPVAELDFDSIGAYSVYNWELFFHVPLTIAIHLSRNGRYEEAQRWFHYVFDPTDDSDGPTPERFWKVSRSGQPTSTRSRTSCVNLATGADPSCCTDTMAQHRGVEATRRSARTWWPASGRRRTCSRRSWRTSTTSSPGATRCSARTPARAINEATQLYVLAANILGPRPQAVPRKGTVRRRPTQPARRRSTSSATRCASSRPTSRSTCRRCPGRGVRRRRRWPRSRSVGRTLYFCVPRNDKLLGYWDTVADRLFKIRNSLNMQGVFRQLPLFDPPIDPAMLARAAAAGLDVAAVVSGAEPAAAAGAVRAACRARPTEICQEVQRPRRRAAVGDREAGRRGAGRAARPARARRAGAGRAR